MRKFAWFFLWLVLAAIPALAQDAPPQDAPPPQDSTPQSTTPPSSSSQTQPEAGETTPKKKTSTLFLPKHEIYAGFVHRSVSTIGNFPKAGLNGWTGSFDDNWKTWLGFIGELQGVYATIGVTGGGTEHPSVYTLMAGPQFFPLKHHKVTPFGHFLYGEGFYRLATDAYGGYPYTVTTQFSSAWEGGGGLDLHIKPNWSVRLVQFDYVSTHFKSAMVGTTTTGSGSSSGGNPNSQGGYRLSFGVIRYFGKR